MLCNHNIELDQPHLKDHIISHENVIICYAGLQIRRFELPPQPCKHSWGRNRWRYRVMFEDNKKILCFILFYFGALSTENIPQLVSSRIINICYHASERLLVMIAQQRPCPWCSTELLRFFPPYGYNGGACFIACRVYFSVMKENGVQAHLTCFEEGKIFVTQVINFIKLKKIILFNYMIEKTMVINKLKF